MPEHPEIAPGDASSVPTGDRPYVSYAQALSNVAWSSQIVGQSLEALFAYLADDGVHHLRPMHAGSLRMGWSPEQQPGDIMLLAAERYDLTPILVHSTSWRFEEGRVVLTYIVIVEKPVELEEHLVDEPVARADLARGDALGATPEIDLSQVIEHAFRHLSWLVKDDDAVKTALPEWTALLSNYEPEPFRAFGSPGPPGS